MSEKRSLGEPENRRVKKRVSTYRDLDVYKMAMEEALRIFELTKRFPVEEKFSLTDQIRRSSRSVCANIGEAWRKRRYKLAFVSKLSDAETEAAETQVWAEVAYRCGYLDRNTFSKIDAQYDLIIGKLVRIIDNPFPWLLGKVGDKERRRRASK
jgi:four helix bundle protein